MMSLTVKSEKANSIYFLSTHCRHLSITRSFLSINGLWLSWSLSLMLILSSSLLRGFVAETRIDSPLEHTYVLIYETGTNSEKMDRKNRRGICSRLCMYNRSQTVIVRFNSFIKSVDFVLTNIPPLGKYSMFCGYTGMLLCIAEFTVESNIVWEKIRGNE